MGQGPGHLEYPDQPNDMKQNIRLWIWEYRYGVLLWSCYYAGNVRMGMGLWIMIYGYGIMYMGLWIWD